jgi:hypothetical protein
MRFKMAQLKNFNTALYVMQLDAESKYNGLLKIGISNNVERRAKEVGSVKVLYHDAYRAPRSVVMVTEMLAQAYAYLKVGRPANYRKALPVRSGSSEFFNTTNYRQALGFITAARTQVKRLADNVDEIIAYVRQKFRDAGKRLPKSFNFEVIRIRETQEQEMA